MSRRPSVGSPPNNPIKLSARPVTHLGVASCAPVQPAAYRGRWAGREDRRMARLFAKDYSVLTNDDREEWKRLHDEAQRGRHSTFGEVHLWHELPPKLRHIQTLFPNHFLDVLGLKDQLAHHSLCLTEFQQILEQPACSERAILDFIRDRRAYFIVGILLNRLGVGAGHHGAYLFPEFRLGAAFVADYLLVGDSSEGHKFVFVELESPSGTVVLQTGEFGDAPRKGEKQVRDWREWLEGSYAEFSRALTGEAKGQNRNGGALPLPNEFHRFDPTRFHWVVVTGRRNQYQPLTYRRRREKVEESKIHHLHYDNLVDSARRLLSGTDHTY